MATATQTTKNMPHKLGGGEHDHWRPTHTGNVRGGSVHRLRTEPYEYDSTSNTVPPAGEYLRAPVCCSECEGFWKALILEVDEKHTSRVAAGKASLVMAKGASGSVLQIKSTKHVAKAERRFFSGRLGCKTSTVRGDAFQSCQPRRASQTTASNIKPSEYPERKLNYITSPIRTTYSAAPSYAEPFVNQPVPSSVSRQVELQASLRRCAVGFNPYISTPRRHGHIPHTDTPSSGAYPHSPSFTQTRRHQFASTFSEANQAYVRRDLKPIRTHPDHTFSHLSTPRRYAPILTETSAFAGSQSARYPSHADSSQLKSFPRPHEKLEPRAQPSTFTPLSQTPRGHHNFPTTPRTPGSRGRWDTSSPLPQPHNIGTGRASPEQQPSQTANPNPNPSSGHGGNLSRASTIESGYRSLSIPRSDDSSDSQELDSPAPSPRSKVGQGRRVVGGKNHRPQDLLRNNLSRTSTSASSLMEPIVLFKGHGCRYETDENSDDDVVVTNPNYFKHIVANPNYVKRVLKAQSLKPTEALKD